MPGRGIFFALGEDEDCLFRELRSPKARAAFLELVCERIRKPWSEGVDKVWDPIHRCLTDGGLHYGRSPLYLRPRDEELPGGRELAFPELRQAGGRSARQHGAGEGSPGLPEAQLRKDRPGR
jgi:hypothetical protein